VNELPLAQTGQDGVRYDLCAVDDPAFVSA
jgi:hypothetical protein